MPRFYRLLLSGLALSSFGVTPALAQTAPAFTPAGPWSVQASDSVTDQCSLQTEFNNGFIMQFVGASDWVQAIHVNFRQTIFEAGQSYSANLTIPGFPAQQVKAIAKDQVTLSLPIKGKKDLVHGLRESAVLDLDVEGNAFRFFLTGIGGAKDQFDICLAGSNAPNVAGNFQYENRIKADDNFMVNEAVALEQAESIDLMAGADIASGELRYETGHDVITHSSTKPSRPKTMSRPAMSPHRRLSDQLAAEIAANPDLVDSDETAVKTATFGDDAAPIMMPAPDQPVALVAETPSETPVNSAVKLTPEAMPLVGDVAPASSTPLPEPEVETASIQYQGQRIIQSAPVLSADEADVIVITDPEPKSDVVVQRQAIIPEPEPDIQPAALLPTPEDASVEITKTEIVVVEEHYTGDADFTRTPPPVSTFDREKLARLSALETEVEILRAENAALNTELENSLDPAAQERISIAKDNWNLEKATRRYNEAERQIKRLGQQLRKERAAFELERQELEALLFDPQLTEQAQLARLLKLERELEATRAQLNATNGGQF